MNRGLLVISMILVVAGIASGLIPLILVGVILLFPAFASRRRVTAESKRETPKSSLTTKASHEPRQPATVVSEAPTPPPPQPTTNSGMLPPIFPVQIFPTLTPIRYEEPVSTQVPQKEEIPRDLLEMGAVFLLARFLSRRRRQPT